MTRGAGSGAGRGAAGREAGAAGEVLRKLSDFHDGRYAPGSPEATEVEQLLATNPRYAEVLDDYRLISDVARCLREKECVCEKSGDELVCCVRNAIRKRARGRLALWTGWLVAAGAAAVVVVALVLAPGTRPPAGGQVAGESPRETGDEAVGEPNDEAGEKTETAATDSDAPGVIPPAADDPEAVRRQIEEARRRAPGPMPGVTPVDEGAPRPTDAGRAFLGVLARDPGEGESSGGAVVTGVVRGSPAAAAGIEPGDVILEIHGRSIGVGGARRLLEIVERAGPGARVGVVCMRGRDRRSSEIVLAELNR